MNQDLERLEYLSVYIFEFTLYDTEMDTLFAQKALEVCNAITTRTTFGYQKDPENYQWYLIMCNMPFFDGKLELGTSIRGAWWEHAIEISTVGLWDCDEQITDPIRFIGKKWIEFIEAMIAFAGKV